VIRWILSKLVTLNGKWVRVMDDSCFGRLPNYKKVFLSLIMGLLKGEHSLQSFKTLVRSVVVSGKI